MPGTQNSPSLRIKAAKQKAPWTFLFLFCFLSSLSAQENSASTEHGAEQLEQQIAADSGQLNELNSRITKLESELTTQYESNSSRLENLKREIDLQLKEAILAAEREIVRTKENRLDIWFQAIFVLLALFTLVVAIVGVIAPYWFTRKAREVADRAAKDTERTRDAADKILADIEKYKIEAENRLANIPSDRPLGIEDKQIVEEVLEDPRSSVREKLQAAALEAQYNKKWDDAISHWKSLITLDPENAQAYFGLGSALVQFGELEATEETAELYELAIKNIKKAASLDPDDCIAYYNWGTALAKLAKIKNDEGLFVEAIKKYTEAIRIKPNFHEVYNNWGFSLMILAQLKPDETLYQEASEKLLNAEEIKEGSGSINLACLASLTNKSEECRTWLEKAKKAGTLPSLQHLTEDPDLNNVRREKWFKEFLAEL